MTMGLGQQESKIAREIWDMKYRLKDEAGEPIDQTPADTQWRVATSLAVCENAREYWADKFHEVMRNYEFIPAGRINAGAARS